MSICPDRRTRGTPEVDGQQQPTTGKIQEAEEGKATEVPECRELCRARHNQLCQEGQKPIQSSNLLK